MEITNIYYRIIELISEEFVVPQSVEKVGHLKLAIEAEDMNMKSINGKTFWLKGRKLEHL
jgi:hypothetical protein